MDKAIHNAFLLSRINLLPYNIIRLINPLFEIFITGGQRWYYFNPNISRTKYIYFLYFSKEQTETIESGDG